MPVERLLRFFMRPPTAGETSALAALKVSAEGLTAAFVGCWNLPGADPSAGVLSFSSPPSAGVEGASSCSLRLVPDPAINSA